MSYPPKSALIDFIEIESSKNRTLDFHGKICELRGEIEKWLSYIPNTFPHYTRHTITHSDEIISQISKLLFADDDFSKPLVKLSAVEAYILVAAAYLHDAGMVTSDKEKAEILESDSWKKWTSGEGGGTKRWNEINILRDAANSSEADATTRHFLADVETRFLIAEFIRGQHHLRAATVIQLHHDKLGRIDFDNPILRDAIAQVCVGHGLRQHELEDNQRFPDARDILGQRVNLRFLAILLRLGDLLDMSVDRACPLLLNAASPLPPDSFAHWSQYSAIKHFLTLPNIIEITAECANQEEDRVLRDWCQWIVDEVRNAKIVMPKARRHSDWQVPDATLEGDNPSIKIRPARDANYIPSKWLLDFDKQAIFNLLAEDLYKNPMVFVRELIQNSLDALRCKIYADLEREGKPIPEYPTQVPEDFRERYNVQLSISEKEIINKLSGETQKKQVLVIEDNGLGMDADIIEKYFLQVGRSFYKSDEFRRKFHFVPTSRFGIGFLSVFAASDYVTVDTFKPSSEATDKAALQITLTGLRNYLLREKSEREKAGTRIEIVLRDDIKQGKLTKLVSDWCKRVEFAVFVNDFGNETMLVAERPEEFAFELPLVTNPNAKYVMRAFPINCPGIEGEIYILAYVDEKGESWAAYRYEINRYSDSHPLAEIPHLVVRLECLHGIKVEQLVRVYDRSEQLIFRLDYRDKKFVPTLSRGAFNLSRNDKGEIIDEIQREYEKILTKHIAESTLAKSENGWKYKQKLSNAFPLSIFWNTVPGTIRIYYQNSFKLVSLDEFLDFKEFYVIQKFQRWSNDFDKNIEKIVIESDSNLPIISAKDLREFSLIFTNNIFFNKVLLSKVEQLSDNYSRLHWIKTEQQENNFMPDWHGIVLTDFTNNDFLAVKVSNISYFSINKNHPFTQWLIQLKSAVEKQQFSLKEEQLSQIMGRLLAPLTTTALSPVKLNLKEYIEGFKNIPELPVELHPPDIVFTLQMFGFPAEPEGDE